MSDWYARWFGKEYLALYPHRDEQDARDAVALIRQLSPRLPARVLDLACGSGRHSRVLREWAWTVGLDLSATLLQVAVAQAPGAPYVRGDMRTLPFAAGAFDLVVNLFTSFGYFATDDEHRYVVREVARVTAPGGMFILDYLNAAQVRATLVPYDERRTEECLVRQARTITSDGRYVEKQITVTRDRPHDADGDRVDAPEPGEHRFIERVRLFTPDELTTMVTRAGFTVTRVLGGYDGRAWTDRAPRAILVAERT